MYNKYAVALYSLELLSGVCFNSFERRSFVKCFLQGTVNAYLKSWKQNPEEGSPCEWEDGA